MTAQADIKKMCRDERSNNMVTGSGFELYGLSTDTKPVEGVDNACIFYEMDTKKVFLFDEQNKTWLEQ
jgi:hypothetical protein